MFENLRVINPEQAAALFRTFLQMVGAAAATNGYMTDATTQLWVGLLTAFAVTAWGVWARKDTNLIASAANVPVVQKVVTSAEVAKSDPSAKVVGPGGLGMLLLIPFLLVALSACVTPGVPPGTVAVVVPGSKVDVIIAKYSPEVAQYCTQIKAAIGMGEFFVNNPSHTKVLRAAKAAVTAYCAAPPSDVATALGALANIWANVQAANAEYTSFKAHAAYKG